MLPFSYPQLTRLYQAAADKPSERGESFELPDELLGFFGYRAIKVDPLRSLGFKLANYQRGIRESRQLFTGGEESLLKGGPKTPNDVIERFLAANKAKFLTLKNLKKDIDAAETLGTNSSLILREFSDRQLDNDYRTVKNNKFTPYVPSANILRELEQISQRTGIPNPFTQAQGVIQQLVRTLSSIPLTENIDNYIDIKDYLFEEEPLIQTPPLPIQPMPNVSLLTPPVQQFAGLQNGLTPIENALLNESEKQMRLKQRGLT
jgi:hypothetical protein